MDAYRFDLAARRLLIDRGGPASDRGGAYWDRHVGSPEKLMTFAEEGHLTKQVLEAFWPGNARAYLERAR